MANGTIIFTSLDERYGLSSPKSGFFATSSNTWDGDVVSSAEYWGKAAAGSADSALESADSALSSKSDAYDSQVAAAASAASAQAALVTITDQYLGPYPVDPLVTPNGNPITIGDIYFNTTSLTTDIYNGTSWQNVTEVAGVDQILAGLNMAVDNAVGIVTVSTTNDVLTTSTGASLDADNTFTGVNTFTDSTHISSDGVVPLSVNQADASTAIAEFKQAGAVKSSIDEFGIFHSYGINVSSDSGGLVPVIATQTASGSNVALFTGASGDYVEIGSDGSGYFTGPIDCGSITSTGFIQLQSYLDIKNETTRASVINQQTAFGQTINILEFWSSSTGSDEIKCWVDYQGSIISTGSGAFVGSLTVDGNQVLTAGSSSIPTLDGANEWNNINSFWTAGETDQGVFSIWAGSTVAGDPTTRNLLEVSNGGFNQSGSIKVFIAADGTVDSKAGFTVNNVPLLTDTLRTDLITQISASSDFSSLKANLLTALGGS